MVDVNTAGIINTAISALPGIIGLIRAQHAATNPGAPLLTDEEVIAALHAAAAQSLAKDDVIEQDVKNRNS